MKTFYEKTVEVLQTIFKNKAFEKVYRFVQLGPSFYSALKVLIK